MHTAIQVFSRGGKFATEVDAFDIRSREHARKLWPFVTPTKPHRLVTWVRATFNDTDTKPVRCSHFRTLPIAQTKGVRRKLQEDEIEYRRKVEESEHHKRAKELIAAELNRRLQLRLPMPWYFKDESASDFHFEGDLLLGAKEVQIEHPIKTSFGSDYRLDVAVLGSPIKRQAYVAGGVEIEMGHAFDGYKALIGKALGFPLISIDISEMALEEITPEWAEQALSATTCDDDRGRRQTFVYLHDLLYPQYVQIPSTIVKDRKHQYLVFASDEDLSNLDKWLRVLRSELGFDQSSVSIARINGSKSKQAKEDLSNEGKVVGQDWTCFNANQCLRISVERPDGPGDLRRHQLHATMARLFLLHSNSVIGYKYCRSIHNGRPEQDLWIQRQWVKDGPDKEHRILPKRLAEPVSSYLQVLEELNATGEPMSV